MKNNKAHRLYYLDNLKILLAFLVITVHLALSYSPNIWWFFKSRIESPMLQAYYQIIATICMGLFFLISAYFMPLSYNRKGASKFLKDRSKMYLVPILLGLCLIILPLHYFYNINFRHNAFNNFFEYTIHIFLGIGGRPNNWVDKWLTIWPDLKFGHLWFLEHLLIYSLLYSLIRKIKKEPFIRRDGNTTPPSMQIILIYIAIMSIATFVVRIWYNLDSWGAALGIIQVEYANLPKYILFIFIGILASRLKWFSTFSKSQGEKWLLLGVSLLIITFVCKGKFSFILASGGLNLQSFVWSLWDCLMCMSLNIGLIVFFRESFNVTTPLLKTLSENTFGVYIFHVPIVTIMQFSLGSLALPTGVKFAIECIFGITLSFAITYLIRSYFVLSKIGLPSIKSKHIIKNRITLENNKSYLVNKTIERDAETL